MKKNMYQLLGGFFAVFLIMVFTWLKYGYTWSEIIPYWNDEATYYHLVKSMLEGGPVGYNGYNGSHALIGNYGFHGFFILLPYFLCAKLMGGIEYYTLSICNVMLIGIGLYLVALLNDIELRKYVWLVVSIAFAPLVLVYTPTCMVEGINYFYALLLAGMFIRVIEKEEKWYEILLGILIFVAMLTKVTWASMFFPYFFILLKKHRMHKRVLLSGILTIIGMGVGYALFSSFSAPYFYSQIGLFLDLIRNGSWIEILVRTIKNIYGPIISAIRSKSIFFILAAVQIYGLFFWNIIYLAIEIYREKKLDINKYKYRLLSIYIFVAYIIGVAALYDGSLVAIRTLYPTAIFALVIEICQAKKMNTKRFLIYSLVLSLLMLKVPDNYVMRKAYTEEYDKAVCMRRTFLEQSMAVDYEADCWDNTIGVTMNVANDTTSILAVPAGMGINFYSVLQGELKPKYFLTQVCENMEYQMKDMGYVLIGSDSIVELYEHAK